MPFIPTATVIEQLRARLASLPLDPAQPDAQDKLFERVGVFGSRDLEEVMRATFASEQRVCFIVPVGNNHGGERGRNFLLSSRQTRLALLLADRSVNRGSGEALVGGANNVGILGMQDRVIENLITMPFEAADLAFVPGEGEPLMIQSDKQPGNLGRECWMQAFTAYAGMAKVSIP